MKLKYLILVLILGIHCLIFKILKLINLYFLIDKVNYRRTNELNFMIIQNIYHLV